MTFLRHKQRTFTALFPHPGNRKYLIPKRFRVASPVVVSAVFKTTSIDLTFDIDAQSFASALGVVVEVQGVPVAVGIVSNQGSNVINVAHGVAGLGDTSEIFYTSPPGIWEGTEPGPDLVRSFTESGTVA